MYIQQNKIIQTHDCNIDIKITRQLAMKAGSAYLLANSDECDIKDISHDHEG